MIPDAIPNLDFADTFPRIQKYCKWSFEPNDDSVFLGSYKLFHSLDGILPWLTYREKQWTAWEIRIKLFGIQQCYRLKKTHPAAVDVNIEVLRQRQAHTFPSITSGMLTQMPWVSMQWKVYGGSGGVKLWSDLTSTGGVINYTVILSLSFLRTSSGVWMKLRPKMTFLF